MRKISSCEPGLQFRVSVMDLAKLHFTSCHSWGQREIGNNTRECHHSLYFNATVWMYDSGNN